MKGKVFRVETNDEVFLVETDDETNVKRAPKDNSKVKTNVKSAANDYSDDDNENKQDPEGVNSRQEDMDKEREARIEDLKKKKEESELLVAALLKKEKIEEELRKELGEQNNHHHRRVSFPEKHIPTHPPLTPASILPPPRVAPAPPSSPTPKEQIAPTHNTSPLTEKKLKVEIKEERRTNVEKVVGDGATNAEQAGGENEVAEVRGEVKSLMLSLFQKCNCGKIETKSEGFGFRIVGGSEAAPNKHPWQAESSIFTFQHLTSAAQVSLEGFKSCGGSLISKYSKAKRKENKKVLPHPCKS